MHHRGRNKSLTILAKQRWPNTASQELPFLQRHSGLPRQTSSHRRARVFTRRCCPRTYHSAATLPRNPLKHIWFSLVSRLFHIWNSSAKTLLPSTCPSLFAFAVASTAKPSYSARTGDELVEFSGCAVRHYRTTGISRHALPVAAGYSVFAVGHYGKTGKSFHAFFVVAGYSGFVVHQYDRTAISCQLLRIVAGYSGCAVHPCSKTAISCQLDQVAAGYSGFAASPYVKSGKSFHALPVAAGYSGFVVHRYGKTGESCQSPLVVA